MQIPRIIFMGSPHFAVPILEKLMTNFNVVGVVTQPDRQSGRGKKLTAPPVKKVAIKHQIPFIQPQKISDDVTYTKLQEWKGDVFVVAAFGQILKKNILDLPRYGCVNVHASLLPRWRGASPIQSAILAGDQETGVTIMLMDAGIDTGPMLAQEKTPINQNENAGDLSNRLALIGAELIIGTLHKYINGELTPQPQPETGITYAALIKKDQAWIDTNESAMHLTRHVLAFHPWPGSKYLWENKILIIKSAHPLEGNFGRAGQRFIFEQKPAIMTSKGALILDCVQVPGKNGMTGEEFLRGARNWVGEEKD